VGFGVFDEVFALGEGFHAGIAPIPFLFACKDMCMVLKNNAKQRENN